MLNLAPEGCRLQYERWSLIRQSPWRWYAVALPAALIAGLTGIGALTAGSGPDRGTIAVAMAALIAAPYAFLMWLEAKTANRLERAREEQLHMMRIEREWRSMSDWELSDRVALLLSASGVRVDWVPQPLEAASTAFAAVGSRPDRGLVFAHVAKGALSLQDMQRVLGEAVLEGAHELVFIAPAGCAEKVHDVIERGAPGMHLELWGLQELLTKAEALSQPA